MPIKKNNKSIMNTLIHRQSYLNGALILVFSVAAIFLTQFLEKINNDEKYNLIIKNIKTLKEKESQRFIHSALETKNVLEAFSNTLKINPMSELYLKSFIFQTKIYERYSRVLIVDSKKLILFSSGNSEIENNIIKNTKFNNNIGWYFSPIEKELYQIYRTSFWYNNKSTNELYLFNAFDRSELNKLELPDVMIRLIKDGLVLTSTSTISNNIRSTSRYESVGNHFDNSSLISLDNENRFKIDVVYFYQDILNVEYKIILLLTFIIVFTLIFRLSAGKKIRTLIKRIELLNEYVVSLASSNDIFKKINNKNQHNQYQDFCMLEFDFNDELTSINRSINILRYSVYQEFEFIKAVLDNIPGEFIVENSDMQVIYISEKSHFLNFLTKRFGRIEHLLFAFAIKEFFIESSSLELMKIFVDRTNVDGLELETLDGRYYSLDYKTIGFNAGNNKEFYIWLFRDITEQKIEEEQIEEDKLKIINSNRLNQLGEMSANIAHEINNPLAIIMGNVTLLKRKLKYIEGVDNEKLNAFLEKIEKNGARINKIIRGLKILTRNGENDLYNLININILIFNVLDFLGEKIKEYDIKIHFDSKIDELAEINEVQFSQVLYNLISNAIDAIMLLEEKWIKINLFKFKTSIQLEIVDSGNGIPKDIRDKILDPFFTTKAYGHGTGLGLSVAKKIIEAHKGKFYIDEFSKNTCFVINIPQTKMDVLEIFSLDEAIDSHVVYRNMILKLFDEVDLNINIDKFKCDKCCQLGKWLIQNDKIDLNEYYELCDSHTNFHLFVGQCLKEQRENLEEFSFNKKRHQRELRKSTVLLIVKIKSLKNILNKSSKIDDVA